MAAMDEAVIMGIAGWQLVKKAIEKDSIRVEMMEFMMFWEGLADDERQTLLAEALEIMGQVVRPVIKI